MQKALVPGTRLQDRFVIKKIVAETGSGVAYLVQDVRVTERLWRVDEFFPKAGSTKTEKINREEQFFNRINQLKTFSHPNLVQLLDGFPEGNRFYVVTEYLEEAFSLETILNLSEQFLPEKQVFEWGIQLCDALDFLHGQAFPYFMREMELRSIFLSRNGAVKLGAYGIRLLFSSRKEMPLSLTAPEVRGTLAGSVAGDLYSLGACLHSLFTRKEPSFPLEPIQSVNPEVSLDAWAIVESCLQENPSDRPAAATEVKNRMEQILHPPVPEVIAPRRKSNWRKSIEAAETKAKRDATAIVRAAKIILRSPVVLFLLLLLIFSVLRQKNEKVETYQKPGPLFYVFTRQGVALLDANSFQVVHRVTGAVVPKKALVAYLPAAKIVETVSPQGIFTSLNTNDTTVSGQFSLKKNIAGLTAGPNGTLLAVLRDENLLYALSFSTGVPLRAVPLPRDSCALAYDPAHRIAYVASDSPPSLTIIEISGYRIKQNIPLEFPPSHLALKEDGSQLYVSYKNFSGIDVFDTAEENAVLRLTAGGAAPDQLLASPQGLFAISTAEDGIYLFDDRFKKRMIPFRRPAFVAADSTGRYLYVCDRRGYFFVIRADTGTIQQQVWVGNSPYALLYVP